MTLVEVNGYHRFLELRSPWNELLRKSDNNCVFLTWEWLKNWWEVFGDGKTLKIILGYDTDGRLAGIAPFMIRRRAVFYVWPVRVMSLMGAGNEVTPDQLSLIALPAYKAEFVRTVFDRLKRDGSWDMLQLTDMREDGDLLGWVATAAGEGFRGMVDHNGICPYIELPPDWQTYFERLSVGKKRDIRRRESYAGRRLSMTYEVWDDSERLDRSFGILRELHQKRMASKRIGGASLREEFWRFHRKVAEDFLKNGWLVMGMLKDGETVMACQYAYHYNNKVYYYQSGIDPRYSRYSAGTLLVARMIRETMRRKGAEYDFLRGSEPYKFEWTNTMRRNVELRVYHRTFRGSVPYIELALRRSLLGAARRLNVLMRRWREGVRQKGEVPEAG